MSHVLHPDSKGNLKYRFRIQRVGVEMEGAWRIRPDAVDPKTGTLVARARYPKLKEDPSVRGFSKDVHWYAIGEVASEPLTRNDLWQWMETSKPDVVNPSCGLHIHMSFRHELDYQQLMDRSYHDYMLLGLHRWGLKHIDPKHHFWPRLRGTNLFCQDVFHADLQAQFKGGGGGPLHDHRYGIVNFPWSQHKTVEIRVLPMFGDLKTGDIDIGLNMRAVRRVLNLTEEYLDGKGVKRDVARSLSVVIPVDFDIPIRAVKAIPPHDNLGNASVRFQALQYLAGVRHPKALLKSAEPKFLREVFYADPFFAAASVDPAPIGGLPEFFPFDEGHAARYGVTLEDLVHAFNRHAPFSGWQAPPDTYTRQVIIESAMQRSRERPRPILATLGSERGTSAVERILGRTVFMPDNFVSWTNGTDGANVPPRDPSTPERE